MIFLVYKFKSGVDLLMPSSNSESMINRSIDPLLIHLHYENTISLLLNETWQALILF